MRMMIVLVATLAVGLGACGKQEGKPEPTTQEATTAAAPEPEAPADTASAPDAPALVPAKDRALQLTATLAAYAAGKFDEAFAELADNAVWIEVGSPTTPELTGRRQIIDFHKQQNAPFSEIAFKPARVIDMGEYVACEAIWSGKHSAPMGATPATNKVASVAGAFVLHYAADGKVDKVWNVFDPASMLTQLGIIPGEAMAPARMPEMVELVSGPPIAKNVDKYKAGIAKLSSTNVDEVLKEHAALDLVQIDALSGKAVKGLAENIAFMQGKMAMMGDFAIEVDAVWGAGDWLVSTQAVSFTYKGGIGDIPARDQKVTLPMLSFVRYSAGRVNSYRDYANGLGLLTQLQVGGAAAPK